MAGSCAVAELFPSCGPVPGGKPAGGAGRAGICADAGGAPGRLRGPIVAGSGNAALACGPMPGRIAGMGGSPEGVDG